MIYAVATLFIKPEMRAELLEAAKACIVGTRKEAGNISYDLHDSVTNLSKLVFVEQWENADALDSHIKTGHFLAFAQVLEKCSTAPLKVEVITPSKVELL